jgi:hypothetical protein
MHWTPLSEDELATLIADAVSIMEPQARCLWDLIRVPAEKWAQHPWGDQGGGFWVVAIVGMQVVRYNDIEGGFNVSRYTTPGVINNYWCNQDELQHTIYSLLRQIKTGESLGRFGPPGSAAGRNFT